MALTASQSQAFGALYWQLSSMAANTWNNNQDLFNQYTSLMSKGRVIVAQGANADAGAVRAWMVAAQNFIQVSGAPSEDTTTGLPYGASDMTDVINAAGESAANFPGDLQYPAQAAANAVANIPAALTPLIPTVLFWGAIVVGAIIVVPWAIRRFT
jgi:hypothetical protein